MAEEKPSRKRGPSKVDKLADIVGSLAESVQGINKKVDQLIENQNVAPAPPAPSPTGTSVGSPAPMGAVPQAPPQTPPQQPAVPGGPVNPNEPAYGPRVIAKIDSVQSSAASGMRSGPQMDMTVRAMKKMEELQMGGQGTIADDAQLMNPRVPLRAYKEEYEGKDIKPIGQSGDGD